MTFRKKWPILFGIILSYLVISYFLLSEEYGGYGSSITNIATGIISLFLLVILILYNIRKKSFRYILGSVHGWFLSHIYLGILSFFVVMMHSKFSMSGTLSILLSILFIIAVASGIIGLLLYKNIPLSMSKFGRDVFTLDEIKEKIMARKISAEKIMSGMSIESRDFYTDSIKNMFKSKRTKWEYLFMEESEMIIKQTRIFDKLIQYAPRNEVYTLKLLINPIIEKEKLVFMLAKIELLRVWLNIHIPLTGALLTAVIIHIISISYF